jgi:hypothetical protein
MKTAVEWLGSEMQKVVYIAKSNKVKFDELMEQAKQMEKEQRGYSKEQVLEHLNILIMMPSTKLDEFTDDKEMVTIKWFEQFKKQEQ